MSSVPSHIFDDTFRQKLATIYQLYSLGFDKKVPRIVVIGSQSVGKSSLIESIANINLPRKEGTCTRCPIECYLIRSGENTQWRCDVTLHYLSLTSQGEKVGKEVVFGPPITDPEEVQERVERAQRAVLNPKLESELFSGSSSDFCLPDVDELRFTHNYVSVKVQSPDSIDLIFCDLPGIIRSSQYKSDIEEVENLVREYIKDEETIILCTTTCESEKGPLSSLEALFYTLLPLVADIENQSAFQFAEEEDPVGIRTIGVLTKPDRIDPGGLPMWMPILQNDKYHLRHGWYCVKHRSKIELDSAMTFDRARIAGEDFFKVPPWSELEFEHKERLGTQALTRKLQELLLVRLNKRLPELLKEISQRLSKVCIEREKLPNPMGDPLVELTYMLQAYCQDAHSLGEGLTYADQPDQIKFNQFRQIRPVHDRFRDAIRRTALDFRPYDKRDPTSNAPPSTDEIQEPPFIQQEEGSLRLINAGPQTIYLQDVIEKVNESRKRELPGYIPFHVIQHFISLSVDQWRGPALRLVQETYEVIRAHDRELVNKHFQRYSEVKLAERVIMIMEDYDEKQKGKAEERVKWLLELESSAFTLNLHYFEDYRKKYLTFYQDKRQEHMRRLSGYSYREPFEPWGTLQSAIETMATVRAYFQVAFKRVVDVFSLAVDRELLRVDQRDLQEFLTKALGINDYRTAHAVAEDLMTEDPLTKKKREDLDCMIEILQRARIEVLKTFAGTPNVE